MFDYKGIKIASEITIVATPDTYKSWVEWRKVAGQGLHQGFVVDTGNTKMLESARRWAQRRVYDESLRPTKRFDSAAWGPYHASGKDVPGTEHTYKNGEFEISLCDSANNSSQGGKLSFWNCVIKCPDGKEFLVGINADILLELMVKNTFVDGKCQSKVWLGRIKGSQVGAFTENMELFAQAKKDEQTRQTAKKADSKYVVGDIVSSLSNEELYLGTAYQYFEIIEVYYKDRQVVIFDRPKQVHVFRRMNTATEPYDYYITKTTKPKRMVTGHVDLDESAVDYIKRYDKEQFDYYAEKSSKGDWCGTSLYNYGFSLEKYGDGTPRSFGEIRNALCDVYAKAMKGRHMVADYDFMTEKEMEEYKKKYGW